MEQKKSSFLICIIFISISLFDMITTIIGINFFGSKEFNIYAFPLLYGFVVCVLWVITDKFIFGLYPKLKMIVFINWCFILSLPSITNVVSII